MRPARKRAVDQVQPSLGAVGERRQVIALDVGEEPAAPRSNPDFSRPRQALPSASLNVRPIAITSPTDFIVDVSPGSASENFSKANRGIFTTT